MKKVKLPPLYLITDRHQLTEGNSFFAVLDELMQLGVGMIQLREKDLTVAELYPLAQELRDLCRRRDCLLLINDRVDLALAVKADGVHLGGHSLPAAVARQILGPNSLIGVSTHNPQEITAAIAGDADFITFGPVYATPSKAAYGAPLGLDKLRQTCLTCDLPIYALGGIKASRIPAIKQSGAYGIAVISALMASQNPAEAYLELLYQL